MIETIAFACEHCTREANRRRGLFRTKSACRNHEKRCFRNPATKACATCGLWECEDEAYGTRECANGHQEMGVNFRSGAPMLVLTHDCPFWVPVLEVEE